MFNVTVSGKKLKPVLKSIGKVAKKQKGSGTGGGFISQSLADLKKANLRPISVDMQFSLFSEGLCITTDFSDDLIPASGAADVSIILPQGGSLAEIFDTFPPGDVQFVLSDSGTSVKIGSVSLPCRVAMLTEKLKTTLHKAVAAKKSPPEKKALLEELRMEIERLMRRHDFEPLPDTHPRPRKNAGKLQVSKSLKGVVIGATP